MFRTVRDVVVLGVGLLVAIAILFGVMLTQVLPLAWGWLRPIINTFTN